MKRYRPRDNFFMTVKELGQKIIEVLENLKIFFHRSLFPKNCVGCGQVGAYLCDACQQQIVIRSDWSREAILFAVPYHQPAVTKLIWLLKYRGGRELAAIFATWLYEALLAELTELNTFYEQGGKIILLPIPLSKKRYRTRGFNQAELIALHLAALAPELFVVDTTSLSKIKDTTQQAKTKNRAARLKNMQHAFHYNPESVIAGRTIILVDDVTTTGATLAEAEKALRPGKPRRIIKVAVAG